MISLSDFSLCRVGLSLVISLLSFSAYGAAIDTGHTVPVQLYFLMAVSERSPIANNTAPAVSVAIEEIGKRSILPNYTLDWEIVYDRCDRTNTLNLFVENRVKFKNAGFIAGGYCASVCNTLCDLTAAMNVTLLGIFCPMQDTVRGDYPNYMSAAVWISGMVPIYVELMKKFKWKRAMVLTTVQENNYYIAWKIREEIQSRIVSSNITIIFCHNLETEQNHYDDTKRTLEELKKHARS